MSPFLKANLFIQKPNEAKSQEVMRNSQLFPNGSFAIEVVECFQILETR